MHRRKNLEFILRDYLSGRNIKKISPQLEFVEAEKQIEGGRIDILATEKGKRIAIELKATNYSTRNVCAQLMNYINYMEPKKGKVIFIAPKVKMGVYTTLKNYHEKKILELYEVKKLEGEYSFTKVEKKDLDDSRKINYFDETPKNYFIKETLRRLSKKSRLADIARAVFQEGTQRKKYFSIAHKGIDIASETQGIITKKNARAIKSILKILE